MEALAALGLASNVLQFIDFGQKLVARSVELFGSASGALSTHIELENLTGDLDAMCLNLLTSQESLTKSKPSREEIDLLTLAAGCRELATEFTDLLQRLKVQNQKSKWASLRQALKSVWNENAIKSYVRRLENYRGQIMARLLELLSLQNARVLSTLNQLSAVHRRCEITYVNESAKIKREIINAVSEMLQEQRRDIVTDTTFDGQREPSFSRNGTDDRSLSWLGDLVASLFSEAQKLESEIKTIQSLQFEALEARHSRIAEANQGTFEWILEPHNETGNSFIDWISSSHGLYWITGKPGSGKSTLMKYLSHSDYIRQAICAWAGSKTAYVASFYFWNPGTDMQKSQQGLLQTLLYHILRQSPGLLPQLIPDRWNNPWLQQQSWTLSELMKAFANLKSLDLDSRAIRFVFFIDGLDEYEGDHYDIISVINNLVTADIKICVSSRPWNVFEEKYGDNIGFKIQIHEHTRPDITRFIQDQLEENHRFIELKKKDPSYQDLVLEITDRANGVFLWVFLVIRSLRRGLSNADTINDFKRRLRVLPTDLKAYFKYMLDSVEEVYRKEAARIYLMCLATPRPLSVTTISFFDQETLDYSLQQSVEIFKPVAVDQEGDVVKKRIKARCPDLLEVVPNSGGEHLSKYLVDFLHRTARDFLETEDIQNLLLSMAEGFDADFYLCQAYIMNLKLLFKFSLHYARSLITIHTVDSFLFHAKILDSKKTPLDQKYTNEMHRLLLHPESRGQGPSSRSRELRQCFVLAIAQGFTEYLRSNMEELRSLIREESLGSFLERPLLDRALRPDQRDHPSSSFSSGLNLDVMSVLFEAGASPTKLYQHSSIWLDFLGTISKDRIGTNDKERQKWAQVIELCIRAGADTSVEFVSFPHDPSPYQRLPDADPESINSYFQQLGHRPASKSLSMLIHEVFSDEEAAPVLEAIRQREDFKLLRRANEQRPDSRKRTSNARATRSTKKHRV